MKTLLLATYATATLLVGCSTPYVKPPLPDNQYSLRASWLHASYQCASSGRVETALSALVLRKVQHDLNTWTFDTARFNSTLQRFKDVVPSNEDCFQIKLAAEEIKLNNQAADRLDASLRQSDRELQSTIDRFKNNKPIFCTTIGNNTVCN